MKYAALALLTLLAIAVCPVHAAPFEHDGLSATLTLEKAQVAADQPIRFTLHLKNTSKDPFNLFDVGYWQDWHIEFDDARGAEHGGWGFHPLVQADRLGSIQPLKAGESLDVPVEFSSPPDGFNFVWLGAVEKDVRPVKQLPVGKYKLTVSIDLHEIKGDQSGLLRDRVWTGKITPEPVDLEIIPAGNPVVKDGLSVAVTMPADAIDLNQPVKFTVQFKNVSDKAYRLRDVDYYWDWKIQFSEADQKDGWQGPWLVKTLFDDKRNIKDVILKPGQIHDITVELKHGIPQEFEYQWTGNQDRPVNPVKDLQPGKYLLTLSIELKSIRALTEAPDYWTGTIDTKPHAFQVRPPEVTR